MTVSLSKNGIFVKTIKTDLTTLKSTFRILKSKGYISKREMGTWPYEHVKFLVFKNSQGDTIKFYC